MLHGRSSRLPEAVKARSPQFSIERASEVIVDALLLGDDQAAARHNVATRTVKRYRARMRTDAALAQVVSAKKARVEQDWTDARRRFLRRAIAKLEQLIDGAKPEQIREVAGAIKIVGELDVVKGALGGNQPVAPPADPTPPPPGAPATDASLEAPMH